MPCWGYQLTARRRNAAGAVGPGTVNEDDAGVIARERRLLPVEPKGTTLASPGYLLSLRSDDCSCGSVRRGVAEPVAQLCARSDVELREQPVQVRADCAVGEVEALADLAVRATLCRQLRDLELLRCQLGPRFGHASARRLAGRAQLAARTLGVAKEAKRLE